MADQNNDLVITWIKEATKEMKENRDTNTKEHKELVSMISQNREEFVIFKTKVNTRTALISAAIGAVVLLTSLLLIIGAIKDRSIDRKDIDHTHEVTTEQPIAE